MTVVVDSSGIADFANFYKLFPQRAARALSLAINDTVRQVLIPKAKEQIYAEVNFPPRYLDDKLDVKQFSTPTQLVAIVRGRDRPTSLARFAQGTRPDQLGRFVPVDSVEVKRGEPRKMKRAFLIPLRAGNSPTGNVGLAVKLRPGERLSNVTDQSIPREIFPNVYLLYGPSVDQVFQGVAKDIQPQVMDSLETQFYRQYVRIGNAGL